MDALMRAFSTGPSYAWREPWNEWLGARDPEEALSWSHSGIAVTGAGDVVVMGNGRAEAHVLSADGRPLRSFETGVTQGHGLRIVEEEGAEVLWIADNGARRRRDPDGTYPRVTGSGSPRVVKFALDGEQLLSLPAPDIEPYRTGTFSPTAVAVDEAAFGGNGDVWVADGYGQSYVHRFRRDGTYVMSLSGEEGAGRFKCPHAVWIDRRKEEPELYVTDRLNHRLQVFDLDGTFKRAVGDRSIFRRPGGLAVSQGCLVVAELEARLAVLGPDDELLGYLGADDTVADRAGFPNQLGGDELPQRPAGLRPGYFNSPHGLVADQLGNLYVTEFVIGGRVVKLDLGQGPGTTE